MLLIAIITFIGIGAFIIALAVLIKYTFLADVDLRVSVYRSPYQRTRAPKPPKPKKVKQPKVKKPKKVKEPRKIKEPVKAAAIPSPATPAPAPTATDAQRLTKIKQVQHQIASVNSMIKNIDTQFQSGGITQEEYMQKKSFLAEKLGGLQAELDQLRS